MGIMAGNVAENARADHQGRFMIVGASDFRAETLPS